MTGIIGCCCGNGIPMGMPIDPEQQLGWQAGAHDCEHGEAQLEDCVTFGLGVAGGNSRYCGALIMPPAACGWYWGCELQQVEGQALGQGAAEHC